jgi:DNA-binding winged helix-turn-helix (wHTH) protein
MVSRSRSIRRRFDLLDALLERPGEAIAKSELLDRVWQGQFVEEGNLTVHVAAIRKALDEKRNGKQYVATVPRQGYQFVADVEVSSDSVVIEEHTLSRITVEHEEDNPQAARAALPEAQGGASKRSRTTVILAAVGLLTALIATFLFYRFGPALFSEGSGLAERTTHQLTRSGSVSGATMSPDGKYFVYRDNDRSLWYGNTAGGNPILIQSPSDTPYDGITLSSDGSEIYFSAGGNLMKMPVLGGPAQKVLDHVTPGFAFSPDGLQVAFVRNDLDLKTSSLVVKSFDGVERDVATIPRAAAFSAYPAWSPDARNLAVGAEDSARPNQYELTSVNVADGSMKILSPQAWDVIGKTAWLRNDSAVCIRCGRATIRLSHLDVGSRIGAPSLHNK